MTINDQIKDEKFQYNINREVAKISALSSGKLHKYEYLTGEDICDLLREKGPTAVKRRFKTQLTAFALYMLCNIFTSTS